MGVISNLMTINIEYHRKGYSVTTDCCFCDKSNGDIDMVFIRSRNHQAVLCTNCFETIEKIFEGKGELIMYYGKLYAKDEFRELMRGRK